MRSGAELAGRLARVLAAIWLCFAVASASLARAEPVVAAGTGLFLPPSGGALGGALHVDAAYAWSSRSLALAPGLRFSGFLGPRDALAGLVCVRATLWRPLASPYLLVGAGPGYHERVALAVEAGAGLGFVISPRIALGGEATYTQVGRGPFRSLYLGPMLQLTFGREP